jgi:hypothetical protein
MLLLPNLLQPKGHTIKEAVRDKINPRDTWIQKHLRVMSRTFAPPREEKIVRNKDISEV